MAATKLGFITSTEVLGSTKTRTVREYAALSNPSGTYFQWRDPKPFADAARVTAVLNDLSNRIEGVLRVSGVVGAAYSQDIGANGQLVDSWTIYWQTTDGRASGEIDDVKQTDLRANFVAPLVSAAIADAEAALA